MCVTNSAADTSGGRQSFSGMYPTRARTCSPCAVGSIPSTVLRPAVGANNPSSVLINVDLPAPFAPTSPVIPGSISTVRSANAVTRSEYRLVNPCVVMMATPRRYVRPA